MSFTTIKKVNVLNVEEYGYDRSNVILEHVYTGRPPPASALLQNYLVQPAPRPSIARFSDTYPPTIVFSIVQDRLLFLAPTSKNIDPLLALEFLHCVADALEEFLGAPLLAPKLVTNYDVVLQIAVDMCDAGTVCNTEPNALREVVEVPNWMGSLLGGFGLPAASPGLGRSSTPSLQAPNSSPFLSGISNNTTTTASSSSSTVPWRRSNVRHTSNELYVDIVEQLSVILAPSGRPISAFACGNIVFNAKISGVPDLLLRLTAPGGKAGIERALDLPCFHQCVRLSRWREQPGELSFVPPDGKFVLAAYECDLLPGLFDDDDDVAKLEAPKLALPASLEMSPALGAYGDELEVRLTLPLNNTSSSSMSANGTTTAAQRALGGSAARPTPISLNSASSSSSSATGSPAVEELIITIPIPPGVRNITDIRCARGEAHFAPEDAALEWRVSTREAAMIGPSGATLRCTIVGLAAMDGDEDVVAGKGPRLTTDTYDYDEENDSASATARSSTSSASSKSKKTTRRAGKDTTTTSQHTGGGGGVNEELRRRNAALMPRSASLSFSVRGWLASGIRVDTLSVNAKSSKGLGAGVTPYKGVKYHTISRRGVEARC